MFQGETDSISILQRRYEASQRALRMVMRENRVRDECLSIALGALQYTNRLSIFEIQARVTEIKRRLAQLEPEEKLTTSVLPCDHPHKKTDEK